MLKKKFIQKEKEKKNINFLIRNTSKKKKVKDFKIAFDKVLKKKKYLLFQKKKKITKPG